MSYVKDSANVQYCLREGLPGVSVLDPRTPPDVIHAFVDGQNEFNKLASAKSFMEIFEQARRIEVTYRDARKAERKRKAPGGLGVEEDEGGREAGESCGLREGLQGMVHATLWRCLRWLV